MTSVLRFSPPRRSILCIAGPEPVSREPRRSSPKASSPTGASRTLHPGQLLQPLRALSGGTNPLPSEKGACVGLPLLSSLPRHYRSRGCLPRRYRPRLQNAGKERFLGLSAACISVLSPRRSGRVIFFPPFVSQIKYICLFLKKQTQNPGSVRCFFPFPSSLVWEGTRARVCGRLPCSLSPPPPGPFFGFVFLVWLVSFKFIIDPSLPANEGFWYVFRCVFSLWRKGDT